MSAPPRPHTDDELFSPTLGDRRGRPTGHNRPWRLGSQFYVAFFGGALAVTPIAAVNGARLGLSKARIAAIVAIGVAGFAATLVVAAMMSPGASTAFTRLPAVLAYGGMYFVQRQADRVHAYGQSDEEAYASLWVVGLVAVIVGWFIQGPFVYAMREDA